MGFFTFWTSNFQDLQVGLVVWPFSQLWHFSKHGQKKLVTCLLQSYKLYKWIFGAASFLFVGTHPATKPTTKVQSNTKGPKFTMPQSCWKQWPSAKSGETATSTLKNGPRKAVAYVLTAEHFDKHQVIDPIVHRKKWKNWFKCVFQVWLRLPVSAQEISDHKSPEYTQKWVQIPAYHTQNGGISNHFFRGKGQSSTYFFCFGLRDCRVLVTGDFRAWWEAPCPSNSTSFNFICMRFLVRGLLCLQHIYT